MRNSRICFAPADGNAGSTPAAAPADTAAPSGTDNSHGIDPSSDAARIFEFDAFGPDSQLPAGNTPASDGQGVSPDSGAAPQPTPTPAPAPAAQPGQQPQGQQPQPPAPSPTAAQPGAPQGAGQLTAEEAALLRRQVEDMRVQLQQANQPAGQGNGQGQGQPSQAPQVQLPAHGYAFNIPPQTAALLTSENPQERIMATQALITGASQIVHQQVVTSIREELGGVIPHIVGVMIRQHAEERAVFEDFYGTFKELNRPELRALVKQTAASVLQEYGQPAWSAQVRDVIGQRVKQIISGVLPPPAGMLPTVAQPQPGAPAAQRPAQPPHMTGTTSRPAGPPLNTQQAEMLDILKF